MGGFFGAVGKNDVLADVYFGTDYHSHLGTKRAGMCVLEESGFNRAIHNISNAPFRSKFEEELENMEGNMGIGAISDSDPQPLTVYSRHGDFAITTVGRINNKDELIAELKTLLEKKPEEGVVTFKAYTVVAGDSLSKICAANNLDYASNYKIILAINGIKDANQIYVGQTILLPIGTDIN